MKNAPETLPQEWLQTNGLGSFASGPVTGPPTRRYHGLLCASLNPPTDRWLLCSHLVEGVGCAGQFRMLSCEHYLHHRPALDLAPAHFEAWPYPTWEWAVEGNRLRKSVIMLRGENTTLVRYVNEGQQPLTLHLKPLLALRGYHDLRDRHDGMRLEIEANTVRVECPGVAPVYLSTSQGDWDCLDDWYHQLYYSEEAARGFLPIEENYAPAELNVTLPPGGKLILRISVAPGPLSEKPFLALEQKRQIVAKTDLFRADIELAAKQFIVNRASTGGKTILAGYPWFTDWGRDTLISLRDFQHLLPPEEARGILKTFLKYEQNGLIPNRFPDNPSDAVEYHTADATLWLFVAAWELEQRSSSKAFIKSIFPSLTKILRRHLAGTDFNIGSLENGLLRIGHGHQALTWMDANIDGHLPTARQGCPVEINMLWYNALRIYQQFGAQLGNQTDVDVVPWLTKFEKNFAACFWDTETKGCLDVYRQNHPSETSIRPNQIYAVSLPFTVLSKVRQKQVLAQVTQHLYTPLGLRTLSPQDPDFRPEYVGDAWSRDTAYHQGTVWPFLLREYWVAYAKLQGSAKTKKALAPELEVLKDHFYSDAGLGSVSEVFDGQNPQHGKGCPQQAWSVAAVWKLVRMLENQ